MKFDSDSSALRSPYSGRHRKEPSYLRVVRHITSPRAEAHDTAWTDERSPSDPEGHGTPPGLTSEVRPSGRSDQDPRFLIYGD